MASWIMNGNSAHYINLSRLQIFNISGWWALILSTFALILLTYILGVGLILYFKIRYKGPYSPDEPVLTDVNTENVNTMSEPGSSFYDTSTARQFMTPANYSEYSQGETDIERSISQIEGKFDTLLSRSMSNSSSRSDDRKVAVEQSDAQSEKDVRNKVYDFFRRSFNFKAASNKPDTIYDRADVDELKSDHQAKQAEIPASPTSDGLRKRKSSIYDSIPSGTTARTFSLKSSVQANRASSESWSRTDTTATMGDMRDLSEPTYDVSRAMDLEMELLETQTAGPSFIYDVAKTEEDYERNKNIDDQTLGTSVQASLASSDLRDYTSTEIPYESLKSYDLKSLLKDPSLTGISAAELRSKVSDMSKSEKPRASLKAGTSSEQEKGGKSVTYDYLTQFDVHSIISRFSDYTTINPDDSISNVGIYSDYLTKRSEKSKQDNAPLSEKEQPSLKSIYKSHSAYGTLSEPESKVYKPLSSASTKSRVSFSLGPDHDDTKYSLGSTARMRKSSGSKSAKRRSGKSSDSSQKSSSKASTLKPKSELSTATPSTATASTIKRAVSTSSKSTVKDAISTSPPTQSTLKNTKASTPASKKSSAREDVSEAKKASTLSSKQSESKGLKYSSSESPKKQSAGSTTRERTTESRSEKSRRSAVTERKSVSESEPPLNAEISVSHLSSVKSKIVALEKAEQSQIGSSAKSKTKTKTSSQQYGESFTESPSKSQSNQTNTATKSTTDDTTSKSSDLERTPAKSTTETATSAPQTTEVKSGPLEIVNSDIDQVTSTSKEISEVVPIKDVTGEQEETSLESTTKTTDDMGESSATSKIDSSTKVEEVYEEYSEIRSSEPVYNVLEQPEYGNLAENRDELIALHPDIKPKTSAFAKFQKMIRPTKSKEPQKITEKLDEGEQLEEGGMREAPEPDTAFRDEADDVVPKEMLDQEKIHGHKENNEIALEQGDEAEDPPKKAPKKGFGKKLLGKLQRTKDNREKSPPKESPLEEAPEEQYRNLGSYTGSKPALYESSSSELTESSYEDEDYSYYFSDSTVAALLKEYPGETKFDEKVPEQDVVWPEDAESLTPESDSDSNSDSRSSHSSSYTESESSRTPSSEYSSTYTDSDSSSSGTRVSRKSDRTSVVSGKTLKSLSSYSSGSSENSLALGSRVTGLTVPSSTYRSDSSSETENQTTITSSRRDTKR